MTTASGTEEIALIGAGAIGLSVAADLISAGHTPRLCVRRAFDRLEQRGDAGSVTAAVDCVTDPDEFDGPVAWLFVATKAHQSASAQLWFDRLCGPETVVVALQNGVDHVERLSPLVGEAEVLPVVVRLPALRVEDGVVERSASGALSVPECPSAHRLAALLDDAPIGVEVLDDWVTSAWKKLIVNAATGGVGALVIQRNEVLRDPEIASLTRDLMNEVAAVGRAEGADLSEDIADRMLSFIDRASSRHWSSIVVDRREGRPLEWEARNAIVGELGRRHGIATPLNDLVTSLLRVADPGWVAPEPQPPDSTVSSSEA